MKIIKTLQFQNLIPVQNFTRGMCKTQIIAQNVEKQNRRSKPRCNVHKNEI